MNRKFMLVWPLHTVVLLLAAWACSDLRMPTEPLRPEGPALSQSFELVRVRHKIPDSVMVFTRSALIGERGGVVAVAGAVLRVPEGAVDAPTYFTVSVPRSGFIEAELRAERVDLFTGTLENVGARGFLRPVELQLNYQWAGNEYDPNSFVILWLRPDGTLEPVPSAVETRGKIVRGQLSHFSRYAIGTNLLDLSIDLQLSN
jgi:hypothetical protein